MTDEKKDNEGLFMNGQPVKLKNPGTQGMADLLKISRDFASAPDGTPGSQTMKYLTNEGIDSMVHLVNITLEKTFPDLDKDKREAWAMENMMDVFTEIMTMCTPKNQTHEVKKKQQLMDRLNKDKQNESTQPTA